MKYKHKRVLVCGMGKSGSAAARLLLRHGAQVTLQDLKEEPVVERDLLENNNISTYFGRNPDEIVKDFDIIVISPGISADLPFVHLAKSTGVNVIGEIELASSVCTAPILAITGTNGKTTTTTILGEIMKRFVPASQVAGNIGIAFCGVADSISDNAYIVAEISSFQLETIKSFRPKISAVLNMTPDHLNRHKTMEGYVAAKERIFENQKADDFCILNYDNEYTFKMADKTKAKVIFFSRKVLDEGVFVKDNFVWVKLGKYNESVIALDELPIPGSHNLENVLAAVAMAVCAGVPIDIIAHSVKDFKSVEHRMEFVREFNGITFYNDSKATNVDSAIMGLNAVNRPVILIGGGQDKGLDYGEWIAGFEGKVKSFIIIGEAGDKLEETCRKYNFTAFKKVLTMKEAVNLAFASAEEGDCILLSPACASFDMFDDYEQRGRVFKELVAEV